MRFAWIMVFALLATSCTDTGSGHNLLGMSASSEAYHFIVSFGTSSGGSFLLEAKTWGRISSGPSVPTGDIVVSDLACNEEAADSVDSGDFHDPDRVGWLDRGRGGKTKRSRLTRDPWITSKEVRFRPIGPCWPESTSSPWAQGALGMGDDDPNALAYHLDCGGLEPSIS